MMVSLLHTQEAFACEYRFPPMLWLSAESSSICQTKFLVCLGGLASLARSAQMFLAGCWKKNADVSVWGQEPLPLYRSEWLFTRVFASGCSGFLLVNLGFFVCLSNCLSTYCQTYCLQLLVSTFFFVSTFLCLQIYCQLCCQRSSLCLHLLVNSLSACCFVTWEKCPWNPQIMGRQLVNILANNWCISCIFLGL